MQAKQFTDKVLNAYEHIDDARSKELVQKLIEHLHGFIVDSKVTDHEWEEITQHFLKVAKCCVEEKRNEFLLLSDVLGASQLVELQSAHRAENFVGSALLGPFYRRNSPCYQYGEAIMAEDEPGERVIIEGKVIDAQGKPIAGAVLDIWQAAISGFYSVQDSSQADGNLRAKFTTRDDGSFKLTALVPTAYPAPTNGPAGGLLRMAKRQCMRPAHIHFIVSAENFETLVTQVFVEGGELIEEDVVFTADINMSGDFVKQDGHYALHYDFQLLAGESILPKSTI